MTSKMKAEFVVLLFGFVFVLVLCVALLRYFGLGWVTTCVGAPFLAAFCIGVGAAVTAPRGK